VIKCLWWAPGIQPGSTYHRVVRLWKRFRKEAVDASFLEVFKLRVDRALSNLI